MIVRSLFMLLLALAGLSVFLSPASAQVVTDDTSGGPAIVYKLTFEVTGESINFRPFQGGYYIAPIEGGAGTLLLTRQTGKEKTYYSFTNFGQLFLAKSGSKRKAVISTSTGSQLIDFGSVSTTALFAIGDASETKELKTASTEGSVFYAEELTGYSVSADSETDLPFASNSASDVGVAGATILRAKLDQARTEDSLKRNLTVLTALAEIILELTDGGYTNGLNETDTGDASAATR